jgi:xylan 1,4-beta-xylosidase
MSYWTFTDIFEESGPVPSPFHGGFGMINFQGLKKPSFYAYQFLNRLGDEELVSTDPDSWITKGEGGAQVLVWDYSPPVTKESNQVFYKKIVPAKGKGKAMIELSGMPAGSYDLKVYQVGFRVNDVYTDYVDMGSPQHLKRVDVARLAKRNDGSPLEQRRIKIDKTGRFRQVLDLRENDVFLVTLAPVS